MPSSPGSFTQLPPNSTGPKLATGATYAENSQTVQDEKVILGEQYLASYIVTPTVGVSIATAADHVFQLMAGATLPVRVRRIELYQANAATAAAFATFELWRLSTAGTGGTAITPAKLDTNDAVAGATVMTRPTVKGTESTLLARPVSYLMQTLAASADLHVPLLTFDFDGFRRKPLVIPAGTNNGIALKTLGYAGASALFVIFFDESSWA